MGERKQWRKDHPVGFVVNVPHVALIYRLIRWIYLTELPI